MEGFGPVIDNRIVTLLRWEGNAVGVIGLRKAWRIEVQRKWGDFCMECLFVLGVFSLYYLAQVIR